MCGEAREVQVVCRAEGLIVPSSMIEVIVVAPGVWNARKE